MNSYLLFSSRLTSSLRKHLLSYSALLALCLVTAGCNTVQTTMPPAPLHTIGFMTDFDVRDDAIGICKAVMDGVAPGVRVIATCFTPGVPVGELAL